MLPPLLPAVAARRSTRGARDPIAGNLLAEERNRPLTATLCMLMSLFLSQSRQGPRGLVALLQQVPRAQEPRSSQCARVCLCCNGLPARTAKQKGDLSMYYETWMPADDTTAHALQGTPSLRAPFRTCHRTPQDKTTHTTARPARAHQPAGTTPAGLLRVPRLRGPTVGASGRPPHRNSTASRVRASRSRA